MSKLLNSSLPIAAAPMAGGPSSVAFVKAASGAGGFGFLAGGNKTTQALADQISEVRADVASFGVNLFAPPQDNIDAQQFSAYVDRLGPEAAAHGIELSRAAETGDDEWEEKLQLLVDDPVEVVSFTFGLPGVADVSRLQQAGSIVLVTVTNATEASAADELGVNGIVVQGFRAGGHSAVHDVHSWPAEVETSELVRSIRHTVRLPIIAAGGVDGPTAVSALLDAGAEAVSVGTMFLRTHEAGTSPTHRRALAGASVADSAHTETVLTRAFTGRPARALRNGFIDRHHAAAPAGYPEVHYLTRELRAAAGAAGDADRLHLWAGTGFRHAPEASAADVVRLLASGL